MAIVTILHSTTAGNVPSSLVSGQLGINEKDRKLYYLDPDAAAPKSLLDQLTSLSTTENMIYNAGMEVDQVNVGAAQTGLTNSGFYLVDNCKLSLSTGITATGQQVTDAPTGYANSVKVSVTGAKSIVASDFCILNFAVEGYITSKLLFGTASASSIVLGFWVKANRTGQYGGSVRNAAFNFSYPFSFTITNSATWQYVSLVVPGPTSGTWTTGNTVGLNLTITMAAGSTFTGTANTWTASNLVSATGQVNGVAATTDFMQVTGVMAHRGNIMVPQERAPYLIRPFTREIPFCQRYLEKSYDYTHAPGNTTEIGRRWFQAGSGAFCFAFAVEKMITPAVTFYSPVTGTAARVRDTTTNADVTLLSPEGSSKYYEVFPGSGAAGDSMTAHYVADARM